MNLLEKLAQSMTYAAYQQLVSDLNAQNLVTGPVQNDGLLTYSRLNQKRMERLDKTTHVLPEVTEKLVSNIQAPITWLTITEGWCGDAAQIVPVIEAVAKTVPIVSHKLLLRDEHTDLIDQFLTNGGRAIPKVLFVDAEGNVLGHWGPRPKGAQPIMERFKEQTQGKELEPAEREHLFEMAKTELHTWYAHNKTVDIQNELADAVLASLSVGV